jgi:coenzyme F420-0:L-glutamate ligase/coenzyme F420-1:gamma-L-glutamate ligase
MASEVRLLGLAGMPEVGEGDDLAGLILDAAARQGLPIEDGDILVVTQKIVSKAEGRVVRLGDIQPSPFALQLSQGHHRDPRHTEVILRESRRILRMDRGNIISETHHGFSCANAGVDASNIPGDDTLALLPIDPDASAEKVRQNIRTRVGVDVAVIISDTFGRPWREGAVNVAIGVAGMDALRSYVGKVDTHGRMMRTTVIAIADELAAAAELVTGKVKGVPVTVIKGYPYELPDRSGPAAGARALIRPPERDMFR